MSTLKVNEVRHLSNTGTANIVLESNDNTNLQTTSTKALSVDGTLTVTGLSTLNGNTVVGNASTDTVTLTSTVSGSNNFSGFTGEIRMYAGNAAGNASPSGWLYCNGNTIAQDSTTSNESWESTSSAANHQSASYQALFNLLKESSDWSNASSAVWGTNKVKLPDFRSRAPVGNNTGAVNTITAGLTARTLSDTAGAETHALITAELAAHNHGANAQDTTVSASTTIATTNMPSHVHPMPHTHTTAESTSNGGSTTTGGTDWANGTDLSSNAFSQVVASTVGGTGFDRLVRIGVGNSTSGYTDDQNSSGTEMDVRHSAQIASIPAHTHGLGSHVHVTPERTSNQPNNDNTSAPSTTAITFGTIATTLNNSGAHSHTITTNDTGSGTAHTILSPIIAVNYIIKV